MINNRKISSKSKKQKEILKKSMSKKAYKEYCQKDRCQLTLGRNYGTRKMTSAKDQERKRKKISPNDYELD